LQSEQYNNTNDKIIENLPLVEIIAHKIHKTLPSSAIDVDDLINSGAIGLIDAIKKFNPSRNVNFKFYATIRIRGAMIDMIRDDWDHLTRNHRDLVKAFEKREAELTKTLQRRPTNDELPPFFEPTVFSYEDWISGHSDDYENVADGFTTIFEATNPLTELLKKEQKEEARKLISILPDERLKLIVHLYYFQEKSEKEIGGIIDVTESRVCQLLHEAVTIMRGEKKPEGRNYSYMRNIKTESFRRINLFWSTINILKSNGITTMTELTNMSSQAFESKFGRKTVTTIVKKMILNGFNFSDGVEATKELLIEKKKRGKQAAPGLTETREKPEGYVLPIIASTEALNKALKEILGRDDIQAIGATTVIQLKSGDKKFKLLLQLVPEN